MKLDSIYHRVLKIFFSSMIQWLPPKNPFNSFKSHKRINKINKSNLFSTLQSKSFDYGFHPSHHKVFSCLLPFILLMSLAFLIYHGPDFVHYGNQCCMELWFQQELQVREIYILILHLPQNVYVFKPINSTSSVSYILKGKQCLLSIRDTNNYCSIRNKINTKKMWSHCCRGQMWMCVIHPFTAGESPKSQFTIQGVSWKL